MCFYNCKFIFQQWGQFQLFGTQPIGLMPAEDRSPHWWRTADDGLNNQRISAQTEKLAYLSVNITNARSTRLLSVTRSDFRWLTHVFDGLLHVREALSSLMIDLFMQMASCWWRECCLQRLLLEVCSGGQRSQTLFKASVWYLSRWLLMVFCLTSIKCLDFIPCWFHEPELKRNEWKTMIQVGRVVF